MDGGGEGGGQKERHIGTKQMRKKRKMNKRGNDVHEIISRPINSAVVMMIG